MAHVTLVRPSMVVVRLVQARSTCPPIGVAYLAGAVRAAGHRVAVIDAVGESIFQIKPYDSGQNFFHGLTIEDTVDRISPETDYIGVSCMFSIEWPLVRRVLREIRRRFPDKPIIIGGEHVTATADWIMRTEPCVDFCVLGEGEPTLVKLLGALESGGDPAQIPGVVSRARPHKHERKGPVDRFLFGLRVEKPDELPLPAWDLMPIAAYLDNGFGYGVERGRNMPMLATRGCPYQCTFCSSPQMWSTKWVSREPHLVLDEMEGYIARYGAQNFSFYDLTAIVKREWILTFCRLVLERGTKFTWQLPSGTRSEAIDSEVSGLLFATGCRNLNYAPESGSPRTLKRIKKRVNLESMKTSMRAGLKNGLVIKSNTIVGFPGETHQDVLLTLKWLASIAVIGVHEATITEYIPYPGTELYDGLKAEGKLPDFSDEYFDALATKGNFLARKSWSDDISHVALRRYIMFGNLMFLGISTSLRPWRLYRAVMNVVRGRPDESRLEATLRAVFGGRLFRNLFNSKRRQPYLASRSQHS